MPSMETQAITKAHHTIVRALRVGMEVIAQHVRHGVKSAFSNTLRNEHAQPRGDIGHVMRCHPIRNLLKIGATEASATVPGGFFEH